MPFVRLLRNDKQMSDVVLNPAHIALMERVDDHTVVHMAADQLNGRPLILTVVETPREIARLEREENYY